MRCKSVSRKYFFKKIYKIDKIKLYCIMSAVDVPTPRFDCIFFDRGEIFVGTIKIITRLFEFFA